MLHQATIPIPFAIGQELWLADYGSAAQWDTCPACFGKLKVKLTLGNGDEFDIDCAYCALGYGPPQGKVREHRTRFAPRAFVAEAVSMLGSDFYYNDGGNNVPCERLSADRAACEAMCEKLNAEQIAQEERRTIANLESKKRSMVWSVGYWRNNLKKAESDVERLREHLGIVMASKKSKA